VNENINFKMLNIIHTPVPLGHIFIPHVFSCYFDTSTRSTLCVVRYFASDVRLVAELVAPLASGDGVIFQIPFWHGFCPAV
jgi:hypothetical protein